MRIVKTAAVQMSCSWNTRKNIEKADFLVREAASKGAQIILLQELFETPYFCQKQDFKYFSLASSLEDNAAVCHFKKVARELKVVLPISFYEKSGNTAFNSVSVIDADGSVLGIYRKTHIPDGLPYAEKFYFTPGDTGFKVWHTAYASIGVGICWDQWFPEAARSMALMGAELLFYPTAIGSEPILKCDSMPHWRRCMQGHAAANIMPVIAANRVGTESLTGASQTENCFAADPESSQMTFYGSSFITDETGAIVAEADRTSETVIAASFDLDAVSQKRREWGVFRDRRPSMYNILLTHGN